MNPLFTWIVVEETAKLRLRGCPKCGRKQAVARARQGEAVPCKRCGAAIPPPRVSSPRRSG